MRRLYVFEVARIPCPSVAGRGAIAKILKHRNHISRSFSSHHGKLWLSFTSLLILRDLPIRTFLHGSSLHCSCRAFTRKSVEDRLPSHIKANPFEFSREDSQGSIASRDDGNGSNILSKGAAPAQASRDAGGAGVSGLYGSKAESLMRGMLGPQGQADARESKAVPIPGKATVEGTQYTIERSTVFENWHFRCAPPVGWYLSKLGSATCKMGQDVNEAVESIQLQVIKGCNVFEIDGAASEMHQGIARAFYEALEAFELDRSGFVMVMRCGLIKEQPFQQNADRIESVNTAAVRKRIEPIYERFRSSSLPVVQLKAGFRLSELTDNHLARLKLRRVSKTVAAGLSPDWIEAYLINVAFNTRLECIDVLLLEGMHTLFDARPDEHIDDDILQVFVFLENQVKMGTLQYYGVSSPHLAPPVPREYPKMPPDAMVPDQFRQPPPEVPPMNLYRLLALAERAGGKDHHFRFVEYPFNLTAHQAFSTPLPYDSNHTLTTLCRALQLTTFGYSPLETSNLMRLPERYHNFPMETDLKSVRMNYFTVCERCVLKEMEIKDTVGKASSSMPPLEHLFVGSVFLGSQRQFTNLYFFSQWAMHYMMPHFRRAVTRFKEVSSAELKEWCKQYEQLVDDMLRLRRRMFEHKHGKKAAQINMSIDHFSPTLARCPMLNQKAINFATYGCNVLLCGFHASRYFHEATELNPAKNGELKIPSEELDSLCRAEQVSYANASPPHPYMLEPLLAQGKFSKQKSKGSETLIGIDPQNPKFPDIPEELYDMDEKQEDTNNADDQHATSDLATSGKT